MRKRSGRKKVTKKDSIVGVIAQEKPAHTTLLSLNCNQCLERQTCFATIVGKCGRQTSLLTHTVATCGDALCLLMYR